MSFEIAASEVGTQGRVLAHALLRMFERGDAIVGRKAS